MNNIFTKVYENLNELKEFSVEHEGDTVTVECNFSFTEDDENFKCYGAFVSHRDILLNCQEGTVNYLVDMMNGTWYLQCYSIELDS